MKKVIKLLEYKRIQKVPICEKESSVRGKKG